MSKVGRVAAEARTMNVGGTGRSTHQVFVDPAVVAQHGVSTTWLAVAFKMSKQSVTAALRGCPVKRHDGKTAYYDLAQAAGYLVKPEVDILAYLQTLKPSEMPPALKAQFWAAAERQQRVMTIAKHLWATPEVMSVLTDIFSRMRDRILLWPDVLARVTDLDADQQRRIQEMVDQLLNDMAGDVEGLEKETEPSSEGLMAFMASEGSEDAEDFDDGDERDHADTLGDLA